MNAREELNKAKIALDVSTDQQLADILKTSKENINSWVKRNRVPDKWKMIISHHVHPLAKLDLTPDKVEEAPIQYGLPADIVSIVEILKEFDTKQRRDVMRCVLEIESQNKD